MKPIKYPVSKWLKDYIINTFQASGRKSLILTGSKQIGKTIIFEALLQGKSVPGIQSFARRNGRGEPFEVYLHSRGQEEGGCVIGEFINGKMQANIQAFNTSALSILKNIRSAPCEWAAIDEIGFLEQSSKKYCNELERLFDEKRVLAVIRKADTPLLCSLRARKDCFLIDLDHCEICNQM